MGGTRDYAAKELMAKGEELIDQCQPDVAIQFFEKALLLEPKNTKILDVISELATEIDDSERALKAFQESIKVAPADNPTKWLNAAQLVYGEKAREYTEQGIHFLKQELEAIESRVEEVFATKKQICAAYCALGELYMTDLCDIEDAERKCEEAFKSAMQHDVGLPEPTQALASLRLTQTRTHEATELLEKTYHRIMELADDNLMPDSVFRTVTGKLLIEVNMYDQACDILEDVVNEDDEDAEVWFLIATCYQNLGEAEEAVECFSKCQMLLKKLKRQSKHEFHLQEQLDDVEKKLNLLKETLENQRDDPVLVSEPSSDHEMDD
uniref:Uncharacterized protein AlNc14C13G1540 n=1 Tax=Albugo laibachii Nc14 TaxID=890382 RepID=F0W3H7_9STRA|nr:conserved hypothetical protein [Albugo laibachii Nc14]CCA16319.1 conserved hypothetical protein [Albugo laibachii Nc14]|eukprot:CCA16319.1 conserved hypothetical protein [Albugo laibachii Nc14]